ncbi:hypothetical protein [Nocardia xishanensis]|uniref:Tetratricopeptide repeat protein n=1 Tax=Nocardia xishanensis TaxID=238964 RepID=A0ABW7XC34_9NOCA
MHFRPTDAPAEIQARYDAFLADKPGGVCDACDLLVGYLDAGGVRAHATLVAAAWALWESAISVHVDDVEEFCARALALLAEAGPSRTHEEQLLRDSIDQTHQIAVTIAARIDATAARPDAELSLDEARELAHRLADTDRDLVRAAALFLRCEVEAGEAPQFYQVNAASCLAKAGRLAEAEALARPVARDPYPKLAAQGCEFQITVAWTILIRAAMARGNRHEIITVWRDAVAATAGLNPRVPLVGSRSAMISILHAAAELDLDEIACHAATVARARLEPKDIDAHTSSLISRYAR